MYKVVFTVILLILIGCNKKEESFQKKMVMESNLHFYVESFVNEHPKTDVFGLYLIKYKQDTSTFLLVNLPTEKSSILYAKPEEVLTINGKTILVNFGLQSLFAVDTSKAIEAIKMLESRNVTLRDYGQSTFTNFGILINASCGVYSLQKNDLNYSDYPAPSIIIKEDTSSIEEYVPTQEELRRQNK